jgi:CTP synthase (UTP-ammonia lyase)
VTPSNARTRVNCNSHLAGFHRQNFSSDTRQNIKPWTSKCYVSGSCRSSVPGHPKDLRCRRERPVETDLAVSENGKKGQSEVADFNAGSRSHIATNDALAHSGKALRLNVQPTWVATSDLGSANISKCLAQFAGFWIGPGSPYASMDGALSTIRLARERRIPLLGTCGGFQHIVIAVKEEYLCNFGVNPAYVDALRRGPLRVAASDAEGAVRAVELPEHPFFIGTLFLPQHRSTSTAPHPLVSRFIIAAASAMR